MNFASLFAGKMLGDGHMSLNRGKPRFNFCHALLDKEYAQYCFSLFSRYLPFGPNHKPESSILDKRNQRIYHRVFYQSKISTILEPLYPLWYRQRHKIIPLNWVFENLDENGLAIWFQDDGCSKRGGNRIVLSTESFSKEEREFLQSLLAKKYNIQGNIDNQRRIDISSKYQVRKFQALVEPLIHPSMTRKGLEYKWREWLLLWNEIKPKQIKVYRTSVYLPYEFYQSIRGEGYSQILNNLLDEWMDKQWSNHLLLPTKRYPWLVSHEPVEKGTYLLTPRFRLDIKKRLDVMSDITGLERSELVLMALKECKL